MSIIVRKPTEAEVAEMKEASKWGCDVSTFDWHYDEEEVALIIEGEVTITYDGGSISISAGDYVVFPKGLS